MVKTLNVALFDLPESGKSGPFSDFLVLSSSLVGRWASGGGHAIIFQQGLSAQGGGWRRR